MLTVRPTTPKSLPTPPIPRPGSFPRQTSRIRRGPMAIPPSLWLSCSPITSLPPPCRPIPPSGRLPLPLPSRFLAGCRAESGTKGAQKVIIFETDGLANCEATASLVTTSSYSYYKIRYDMNNPSGSEFPSVTASTINNSTVLNQVYSLVQQLATTYGTSRNPFRLYAIGFGPVFQGANSSSAQTTLQTMQYYAGTQSTAPPPRCPRTRSSPARIRKCRKT